MRILFSCRPAYGHLYPLMPLAIAARNAGHEVVFGTGDTFVDKVRALGFDTYKVGESIQTASDEATRRHGEDNPLEVVLTMFGEILPQATIADLTPLLPELRPDLVVYEMSDIGAATAARRARIPVLSHVIGRSMPAELRTIAADRLAPLWDGATPANLMLGDAGIDLWPDSLRDPGLAGIPTLFRLRPVPWNEPGTLPSWLDGRDRPLVYLTLGTVAFGAMDVLRAAIDGLSRLPVDVLVARGPGDPAAVGEVPANVHVTGFVPQAEVLPRADLVVHHGGTGTVLGSLSAGVPQLVLPQGADQFVNAESLEAANAGRALVGDQITAAAVEERAKTLLDDRRVREVAAELRHEIAAMPSPAEVVRRLEEFAAR
ncbi:glycosyltransferase [Amycolatopsis regifaucium]|uniref:Glycosyl transferase n=1 Tax=Amycolatopsis regifaucium TaxID=546365 RepID=A0A154ML82_9PSEU|nr:nucleotide disphospho-sugar-binding domain-containing protein [Amycolatopsis regifaucium]KZB85118.1 glycosyl transferase [Amycolatopsis regifaucium]OKA04142.1 glycosyl transferase [Amycolatopsis regifaucium]SFH93331.1 glycosyltransferase, MGT family [Amycolatopsis regifaucium]